MASSPPTIKKEKKKKKKKFILTSPKPVPPPQFNKEININPTSQENKKKQKKRAIIIKKLHPIKREEKKNSTPESKDHQEENSVNKKETIIKKKKKRKTLASSQSKKNKEKKQKSEQKSDDDDDIDSPPRLESEQTIKNLEVLNSKLQQIRENSPPSSPLLSNSTKKNENKKDKKQNEKDDQAILDIMNDNKKQKLKRGTFSKEEKAILHEAFRRAIDNRNIRAEDVCNIDPKDRLGRKLVISVWREVYDSLPTRDRWSIYAQVKRTFTPAIGGPWSKEEETLLLQLVSEFGTKWAAIAKALGRTARGVQAKYKDMALRKGIWTPQEDEHFVRLIKELHPGPRPPQNNIAWSQIAKHLGRAERACRERYWGTLYSQLSTGFQKNPFTDDDDQELIVKIFAQGAEDTSEVNWELLTGPKFHGSKCRKRFAILCRRVPGYHTKSLDELLGILVAIYKARNDEKNQEEHISEDRKKQIEEAIQKLRLEGFKPIKSKEKKIKLSSMVSSKDRETYGKQAKDARESCLIM